MQKQILNYPNYIADTNGFIINKKGNILKESFVSTGYKQVTLCNNGKLRNVLVHRIIAETFLENKENKPQVNHINGNKNDNRLVNIEWNTRSENQLHSIRAGLRSAKGEKNSQSKLTETAVREIFADNRAYSLIAKDYNVSVPTICSIKKRKLWVHVSYNENDNKKQELVIK